MFYYLSESIIPGPENRAAGRTSQGRRALAAPHQLCSSKDTRRQFSKRFRTLQRTRLRWMEDQVCESLGGWLQARCVFVEASLRSAFDLFVVSCYNARHLHLCIYGTCINRSASLRTQRQDLFLTSSVVFNFPNLLLISVSGLLLRIIRWQT